MHIIYENASSLNPKFKWNAIKMKTYSFCWNKKKLLDVSVPLPYYLVFAPRNLLFRRWSTLLTILKFTFIVLEILMIIVYNCFFFSSPSCACVYVFVWSWSEVSIHVHAYVSHLEYLKHVYPIELTLVSIRPIPYISYFLICHIHWFGVTVRCRSFHFGFNFHPYHNDADRKLTSLESILVLSHCLYREKRNR